MVLPAQVAVLGCISSGSAGTMEDRYMVRFRLFTGQEINMVLHLDKTLPTLWAECAIIWGGKFRGNDETVN